MWYKSLLSTWYKSKHLYYNSVKKTGKQNRHTVIPRFDKSPFLQHLTEMHCMVAHLHFKLNTFKDVFYFFMGIHVGNRSPGTRVMGSYTSPYKDHYIGQIPKWRAVGVVEHTIFSSGFISNCSGRYMTGEDLFHLMI